MPKLEKPLQSTEDPAHPKISKKKKKKFLLFRTYVFYMVGVPWEGGQAFKTLPNSPQPSSSVLVPLQGLTNVVFSA